MCEPFHSIVQYPDQDNDGNPTSGKIDVIPGMMAKWTKKIASWFHLSKMGFGHSETVALTPLGRSRLPEPTRYEAAWWNRQTKIDGPFQGLHQFEASEALESAKIYSKAVSTGNLHTLRKFLEASLMNSDRPLLYVHQALEGLFTTKGQNELHRKFKMCKIPLEHIYKTMDIHMRTTICGLMLGMTRNRKFLVSEWADDDKLWIPPKGFLITN